MRQVALLAPAFEHKKETHSLWSGLSILNTLIAYASRLLLCAEPRCSTIACAAKLPIPKERLGQQQRVGEGQSIIEL
jgi:hypothetical protein